MKMMDDVFMFGHLDPANQFAMGGLNMAFAAELEMGNLSLKCFLLMLWWRKIKI